MSDAELPAAESHPALPPAPAGAVSFLSRLRQRLQWPLLVLALTGLTFAPIQAWQTRSRWMRIFDKLYGDPTYEALRRYDLDSATVPRGLISVGNASRDGIPSLTNPLTVSAESANSMRPDDRVIGVVVNGQARAYPLKILIWHEVANDRLDDVPLAVTYCALCDSTMAFDRRTDAGEIELTPSGLLYNSNVLFYTPDDSGDVRGDTLWSQLKSESVLGPHSGNSLCAMPHELTTWDNWRKRHPRTTVLSDETGTGRDYNGPLPYGDYFAGRVNLPVFAVDPLAPTDRLDWLDRVLGVWSGDKALAIPLSAFGDKEDDREIEIEFAGETLRLAYSADADSLRVTQADSGVRRAYAFWFAWYAFHPATEIYQAAAAVE